MLTSSEETLPNKAIILNYWKAKLHLKDILIDWGEPSCWACGWGWNGRYDIQSPKATWEQILKAWEKAPLQRCHILPRSLNGSDDVSNLFLMCRECHDLAPNTTNIEFFLKWASEQSWLTRSMAKLKVEINLFGTTEDKIESLNSVIKSESFKRWSSVNMGIHFPQSGYSSPMSRITASSVLGVLLKYLQEHSEKGMQISSD